MFLRSLLNTINNNKTLNNQPEPKGVVFTQHLKFGV